MTAADRSYGRRTRSRWKKSSRCAELMATCSAVHSFVDGMALKMDGVVKRLVPGSVDPRDGDVPRNAASKMSH